MSNLDDLLDGYPKTLTVEHLVEILGRRKPTIYKWLQSGEIPAMRIGSPHGGTWVILREDVRDWLESRRNTPKGER
jgi:excisionase family DNA binding protein